MKILQVTKYYYPAVGFGGPVQCSYNLSKYLIRKGHDVVVYTTDALTPSSNERIEKKIQIIEGAEVHFFPNIAGLSQMFISPAIVRAFIDNIKKYDIIHLHEYRTFQNIAFLLCKSEGPPYVLEGHGIKPPKYAILEGKPMLVVARSIYDHTFGEPLLKGASRVVALTRFERTLFEQKGVNRSRIVTIPNAISPEDFQDPPSPNLFKARFGITEEKIILYIGRINKQKGIATLVKACSLLSRNSTDMKLLIAGPDDGYLKILKGVVASYDVESEVLFTGPMTTREEKLAAYSCADVVVYPGIYEGFPIVPLEAGIMGKPLVVTEDPGMSFVSEGKFGLTFEYGNEYQLKHMLETVLQDHNLARRLGQNGKKCVLENYTWEIVGRRIEDLYEEILGSAS